MLGIGLIALSVAIVTVSLTWLYINKTSNDKAASEPKAIEPSKPVDEE